MDFLQSHFAISSLKWAAISGLLEQLQLLPEREEWFQINHKLHTWSLAEPAPSKHLQLMFYVDDILNSSFTCLKGHALGCMFLFLNLQVVTSTALPPAVVLLQLASVTKESVGFWGWGGAYIGAKNLNFLHSGAFYLVFRLKIFIRFHSFSLTPALSSITEHNYILLEWANPAWSAANLILPV